jgi:hypothetical protein
MRGFDCAAVWDRSTLPSNAIEFSMMKDSGGLDYLLMAAGTG